MVRTDFKEQKLEKFFNQADKFKTCEQKSRQKVLDVSLTKEDEEEHHKLFLEGVENFENKILDRTDNDILMQETGKYLLNTRI